MHIREVTIENVRRFGSGDSQLHLPLPEKGWIVVAGPNGSGKTTFLQVLALGISKTFREEYARTSSSFLRLGEKAGRSIRHSIGTICCGFVANAMNRKMWGSTSVS